MPYLSSATTHVTLFWLHALVPYRLVIHAEYFERVQHIGFSFWHWDPEFRSVMNVLYIYENDGRHLSMLDWEIYIVRHPILGSMRQTLLKTVLKFMYIDVIVIKSKVC